MYSLVVLLSLLATSLLPARLHRRRAPGAALAGAVRRSRSRPRSTPTTGRSSSAWRCSSSWLGAAVPRAGRRAAARGCATARSASALAALLYLPWLPTLLFQAAHTGAPWSRKPDYEQLTMEATHRLLGHTAWLVLVVAAGRRRGRARAGRPRAGS